MIPTQSQVAAPVAASWRDYSELGKPRVVALIVFTAVVGMFLATPALPPLDALVFGTLGIGLAASSAAAINHVLDQRYDRQMARTRRRPIPTGHLNTAQALAIARREDYARAGIPMLPVAYGVEFTRLHILLYTILLLVATLLPYLTGMSGLIYLVAAVVLGAVFVRLALRLWRRDAPAYLPMQVFRYSINYLMLLFAALLVDHYLLLRP